MWRISTEIQLTPLPGCHLIHTILSILRTKSFPRWFNAQPPSKAITITSFFHVASPLTPPLPHHHRHWPILCTATCDLFHSLNPLSLSFAATPALSTIQFIHVAFHFTSNDQETNEPTDWRICTNKRPRSTIFVHWFTVHGKCQLQTHSRQQFPHLLPLLRLHSLLWLTLVQTHDMLLLMSRHHHFW